MAHGESKYKAIFNTLCDEIMAGRYRRPMSFPSVARIVRRFGVAHLTAVKVLDELKRRGLVKTRQGAGTYVSSSATKAFGLIVPAWPKGEFFPVICQAISSFCQTKGRPLLFADTSFISATDMATRLSGVARSFVEQRVSGVFYHPIDFRDAANSLNRRVTDVFQAADIPLVLIDCDMEDPPATGGFDVIGIDNMAAGWRLGDHVLSLGARRILFVSMFQEFSSNVQLRCVGVRNAVSAQSKATFLGSISFGDGAKFSACVRRQHPDAIICSSDTVAVLVLKRLANLNIRVPEDVMVAGVNDLPFATMTMPTLTTIHQPCFDIARTAFAALESRLENPDEPPRRIFLPAPLVIRESTGNGFQQKRQLPRSRKTKGVNK
ncbi:MAG: substrate-binding domain-containing protein [Kiritimatiellae bacterium]|nr:substrate-binding domain-containing protein [Kiritimatiellia bacterium]